MKQRFAYESFNRLHILWSLFFPGSLATFSLFLLHLLAYPPALRARKKDQCLYVYPLPVPFRHIDRSPGLEQGNGIF